MEYFKVGKATSLALLAILAVSIVTIAGPTTTTRALASTNKSLDFATNIEYIRGHLEKAVENKDAGNNTLAIAHAGHPVAEVYSLIKADIQADDVKLNSELERKMNALYEQIGTNITTTDDVKAKVAEINASLDAAVTMVIGNESINSTSLWAQVAMVLLETSTGEYNEGVVNGTITQMVEYQDANAFMHRAEVIFGQIKSRGDQANAKEIDAFFEDLHRFTTAKAEPAQIEAQVKAINSKIATMFKIERGTEVDAEAANFALNIELIKGHMSQAVKNVKNNEYELAAAHAGHPISENYALLKDAIREHNRILGSDLESALMDLSTNIKNMSTVETKAQIVKISRLLNTAELDVLTPETWANSKFRATVVNMLLSTVQGEYAEAIKNGKVAQIVEYQDAEAFTARANVLFRTVQAQLPTQEAQKAKSILSDLTTGMKAVHEPSLINTLANGAIKEIQEGAKINAVRHEMTSAEFIAKIRTLLNELKQEYAAGNNDKADSLAVEAYLDNFEHVEGPLVSEGQSQLKEDVEQLMRVQLRNMINEKLPTDQVNAHIATILEKLDQVEKVLS